MKLIDKTFSVLLNTSRKNSIKFNLLSALAYKETQLLLNTNKKLIIEKNIFLSVVVEIEN